jgi:hypothetical protein
MAAANERPEPTSNAGSTIETVGTAVAVATALCLATAFVYDSVHYFVIDHRLVHALTLADHIETAVRVVPYIMLYLLVTAGIASWRGAKRAPLLSRPASLAVCGLAAVAFASLWLAAAVPLAMTVDLLGVTALLVFSLSLRIDFSKDKRFATFAGLGLVWVVFTLFTAVGSGIVINTEDTGLPPEYSDVVTVKQLGPIAGQVVSIIDRGVLIKTYQPLRRVRFIPKEDVLQVDMQSPWTTPPARPAGGR